MNEDKKTILFAGGGTIGPVTPLLAVYEELKSSYSKWSYLWVGTKNGPERKLIAQKQISFYTLPMVKLDRFFSLRNIVSPFLLIYACIKAWKLLNELKPNAIITAGGFIAVPLVWMAWLKKIPSHIHQLDIRPGLANKLMSPFAKTISVTFPASEQDYKKGKTTVTGGPVRQEIFTPITTAFTFDNNLPVLFIFGGGTGAQALNEFVWGGLEELTKFANIIHITGKDKGNTIQADNYRQKEFLTDEMAEAYDKADLVVTRGGLGTFLELSALKKPAVIIPIPNSHQEDNAEILWNEKAAHILDQTSLSPQLFAAQLKKIISDKEKLAEYGKKIHSFYQKEASSKIANIIVETLSHQKVEAIEEGEEQEEVNKQLDLSTIKKVHFVGIGGIGISYIAYFFLHHHKVVSGSDLSQNMITDQLAQAGAIVLKGHESTNVTEDIDLIVYNDAIPLDNPELVKAKELGIKMMTNFQVVGQLSKDYHTIVVAGNKGKTTTTAMISHILIQMGCDPSAMVGSVVNDWKCNFRAGKSDILVVEGDEFKEHFLEIDPDVLVITNIVPDHLDYYKTEENYYAAFQKMVDKLPEDGLLVINDEDTQTKKLDLSGKNIFAFSSKKENDLWLKEVVVKDQKQELSLYQYNDKVATCSFPLPGTFNIENALASIAVALSIVGHKPQEICDALSSFKGTWRRFQILGQYKQAVIISDYAHHPTAVHATIKGAKEFYPGQRLIAVFQAHTRHRTQALFDDFVASFDLADVTVIPDIHAVAGRETITKEEMNAQMLVDAIKKRGRCPKVIASGSLQETKTALNSLIEPNDVVLMMGAGDIYRLAEELG